VSEKPLGYKDEFLPYMVGRYYDDLRVHDYEARYKKGSGKEENYPVQILRT
jgi:hypothetical protein